MLLAGAPVPRPRRLALRSALAANREFERGAPDPLTNLSLAIARGALDQSDDGADDAQAA
jgi:hypothetical protein